MARSTFKVLFYLKRQAEQNGKAPIMGRITINGTISQFSCKLSVSPKLWDTKANKASGKSIAAQRINEKLENIKTNIGKQYQRICDRDSYVTAEKVKNAWLGFGDEHRQLLQTFDEYLEDFAIKRGGDGDVADRRCGTAGDGARRPASRDALRPAGMELASRRRAVDVAVAGGAGRCGAAAFDGIPVLHSAAADRYVR